MTPIGAKPLVLLMALLVLTAGIILLARRRRRGGGGSFRPPIQRHWITRLVCGILGGGILGAMIVGTWNESRVLRDRSTSNRVSLPARTIPAPPESPKEVQTGRFLIHFVAMEYAQTVFLPMEVRSFDLHWPKDRNRAFASVGHQSGVTVKQDFSVDRLEWILREGRLRLSAPTSSRSVSVETSSSYSGSGSSLEFDQPGETGWNIQGGGFLSIAPRPISSISYVYLITPISDEDPLREASLVDFSAWRAEVDGGAQILSLDRGKDPYPAPALRLIEHLRAACLPLLAAAILLTQLFARRTLAFVGVVTFLVLFIGTIDRLNLQAELTRLADRNETLYARLSSVAQAQSTLFFWKSAERGIRQVAEDKSAPDPLRRFARRVLTEENGWRSGPHDPAEAH